MEKKTVLLFGNRDEFPDSTEKQLQNIFGKKTNIVFESCHRKNGLDSSDIVFIFAHRLLGLPHLEIFMNFHLKRSRVVILSLYQESLDSIPEEIKNKCLLLREDLSEKIGNETKKKLKKLFI